MMRAVSLLVAFFALTAAAAMGQQAHTPSTKNVLTTPAPAVTFDPAFAVHPLPADVQEGSRLFQIHCSSCHGANLQGGDQAPPLLTVNARNVDYMLRTGRMPAEIPWEQEQAQPPMFSRPEIRDIVSFVASRSSGVKMLPVVRLPGDLEKGREVFAENCEQCHSATAHGNNVGYADVAPSLMDSSPEQIAEAVRMGPDVMPHFGPKVITDRNLDNVITYVEWLQNAKYNPGGLQLANWGPVSEGFVVWVFGLGLLVLLIRRIGTTD